MKYRIICLLGLVFIITGCHGPSGFETYYVPENIEKTYHEVEESKVVQVGVKNPEEIRRKHYPEAVLIGTSEFIGTYESESALENFAEDIGSDVVIWYSRWIKSTTTTGYHYYTDVETYRYPRYRHGRTGRGDVTVYRDRVEPYTYTVQIFEHAALFLRTKNAVNTKDDDDDKKDKKDRDRRKKKDRKLEVEGKEILKGDTQ